MRTLEIVGLRVDTKIGVYEWEQRITQRLLIDITIDYDFSNCADALESSLDYEQVCKTVTDYVQSTCFKLIETVANNLIALLESQFTITGITLCVSKPQAIKNATNIRVCATQRFLPKPLL